MLSSPSKRFQMSWGWDSAPSPSLRRLVPSGVNKGLMRGWMSDQIRAVGKYRRRSRIEVAAPKDMATITETITSVLQLS
jgi:hypothetical protein